MNNAIRSRKDFRSGNTEVYNYFCSARNEVGAIVKLHGNKIAEVYKNSIVLFDGGWQTVTTKSRLNAIIDRFCNAATDGVFQKNYQWFVRDNGQTVDFVNGYTFAE